MKKILMISILAVSMFGSPQSFGKETDQSQQIEKSFAKSNNENAGFNLSKNYSPPLPQNRSYTLWHFQITTPEPDDYPPSFLWHSDRPFQDSTLSLLYGNKIVIKKEKVIN